MMSKEIRETWHPLTPRVQRLRQRISQPKELLSLRDVKINLPCDFWEDEPIIRRGMMFLGIVDAVVTPVREDELIVGDMPYHEFLANREVLPTHIKAEEREKLRAEAIEKFRKAMGVSDVKDFGKFSTVFGIAPNFGHIIADYQHSLNIGFGGIKKKIEQRLSELSGIEGEEAESQRHFLSAALFSTNGAERYIQRYAEEAQRLADAEKRNDRKAELQRIALICAHIATNPPRSFYEALQLVWFTQLLLEVESGMSAFSIGRLDQYLYPYLQADLDSGRLSFQEAQELVDCFWLKTNEQNNRCADTGRAIIIGGVGPNGEDLVNDLTYMMLDASGALRLIHPKFNARIHSKSPMEYIRRCCEVAVQNTGPQLYNDDQIIPSLLHSGFAREDTIEYGVIGCYETGIPGKERPWPMSGWLNLGKCLELALNDGICQISGKQIGLNTGKLSQFHSYEQVDRAYQRQTEYFVKLMVEKNALDEYMDEALRSQPFLSTLMHGCIESGKDISAGGAMYTNVGVRCAGLSAVADSLMALKTLVYERRMVDAEELQAALRENFAFHESLRQILINRAPKYGNDNDLVDHIAGLVGEHFCEEVLKYRNIRGGRFKPGLFSYYNFMGAGHDCGALPNGRKAHQPFVNGVGPMQGMDKNGPTAMLRSAAKLNYLLSPNANTLDLKLNAPIVKGEEGITRLSELVKTYFDMGGMQLQLNLLSSEELRQAKRNPQEYSNILVRVAGWSAYFVTLGEDIQDEIISRSEHVL